jgi:hypothetical protein
MYSFGTRRRESAISRTASSFTPAELQDLLRPLVAQLARAGVPRDAIAGICTACLDAAMKQAGAGGSARAFAADADDRAVFTAADAPRYAEWFGAGEDGLYPGGLHLFFGLDVKSFSQATGMRRAHRDGRWHWLPRPESDARTFSAPGPPPRPGLVWNDGTKRWRRPDTGEEHDHTPGGAAVRAVNYHGPVAPGEGWTQVATDPNGVPVWQAPAKKAGLLGGLFGKKKAAEPDRQEHGHTSTDTLQARMAASPEYQAATKAVEAGSAFVYNQLAKSAGTTADAVKRQIAAKAQALADSQEVYVRVKDSTLPLILQSGRFKTTHETGTGGGVTDKRLRAAVEQKGMGVSPDDDPATKPISVYLGGKDFSTVGQEKGAEAYGNVVVKLKPSVRDRSTVTFGDSLSVIQNGDGVASPLTRISPLSVNARELARHPDLLDGHGAYHTHKGFIEGQVHGGVSTSDIEEVGFQSQPDAGTVAALAKAGIKWRRVGGPAGKTFAAGTPAPPAGRGGKRTVRYVAVWHDGESHYIFETGARGRAKLRSGVLVDAASGAVSDESPLESIAGRMPYSDFRRLAGALPAAVQKIIDATPEPPPEAD